MAIFPARHPQLLSQVRHATHKSGGSTANGRTSQPKFLGFKKMHGASVLPGHIILRQRGTKWHPATDVGMGKDHTLFALRPGRVVVWYDLERQRRFVSVDDGTLGPLPSRVEMKRRLADQIDIPKYLQLDSKGRYDMVMDKITDLTKSMKIERDQKNLQKLELKGTRKFDLVDLTLL